MGEPCIRERVMNTGVLSAEKPVPQHQAYDVSIVKCSS